MSKQLQTVEKKKSATNGAHSGRAEVGRAMLGSEILVEALEREGVEHIFAYPGGASMELHQALTRSKIRTILPRHEQGGSFAAEGYARASGKAGVCMATSGPGATNLVSAIADAYMDSIPLVAITGQVPQAMIGKGAFQETDFFGMTLPIVKHSYLITDINDIPRIVKEAFYIARAGGPARWSSISRRIMQQAKAQPVWPKEIKLRGYKPDKRADDLVLNEIIGLIEKAERPVLYCGGGIITGDASEELLKFAEATGIPVTTTIMGVGGFPETHPLSMRWLGMHGAAYANWAVSGEFKHRTGLTEPMVKVKDGADLLLAFGVRFDDRVTGKVDEFCKTGTIVHIDIDQSEHNKNRKVQLPIESDIKYALTSLERDDCQAAHRQKIRRLAHDHRRVEETSAHALRSHRRGDEVAAHEGSSSRQGERSDPAADGDRDALRTDQGRSHHHHRRGPAPDVGRRSITNTSSRASSSPAPDSARWATAIPPRSARRSRCPDKQVIDIDGDGSFLMNVQELATAHIEKIAAKAIILNNQHLGMVVQWEDNFYEGNRGHTFLGDPENRHQIYPDYVGMAKSFNVPAERVMFKKDLRAAMQRMLDSDQPYLLDVITPYTEHVLPFIRAGGTVADMIY